MMTAAYRLRNRDLERLTITLTVPKIFRFRMWLGTQIVKLGVRITGANLEVKKEP